MSDRLKERKVSPLSPGGPCAPTAGGVRLPEPPPGGPDVGDAAHGTVVRRNLEGLGGGKAAGETRGSSTRESPRPRLLRHLPGGLALGWTARPERAEGLEEERTSRGVGGRGPWDPRGEGPAPGGVGGWDDGGHAATAVPLTTPWAKLS